MKGAIFMKLAGINSESVVDGDGIRMTIFGQGCPHHCKGCHNPSTWDFSGGTETSPEAIIKMVKENPLLDGVTFSGGEPFVHAKDFAWIAKKVHQLGLSVWSFSGYTLEELQTLAQKDEGVASLLAEVDVLVDGRFILSKRDLSLRFRGSTNQRVIDMVETRKRGEVTLLYND